jgi:hypothetical protein
MTTCNTYFIMIRYFIELWKGNEMKGISEIAGRAAKRWGQNKPVVWDELRDVCDSVSIEELDTFQLDLVTDMAEKRVNKVGREIK